MGGDPHHTSQRQARSNRANEATDDGPSMQQINEEFVTLYELLEKQGVSICMRFKPCSRKTMFLTVSTGI